VHFLLFFEGCRVTKKKRFKKHTLDREQDGELSLSNSLESRAENTNRHHVLQVRSDLP